MELHDALTRRRSWRSYDTERPVEREKLDALMDAAMRAPVSCNLQLTRFVIIDDPTLLERLTKKVSYKFGYAPACVVVAYDPRLTVEHRSAVMTAGMMVENVLLKAVEFGLVTCPMAGFGGDAVIKKTLGIPDPLELLLLVAVGYPKGKEPRSIPKAPKEDSYSFNTYGDMRILNASPDLAQHDPEDIAAYRSRIAPVYLERFRLHTLKETYYAQALDAFSELELPDRPKILDLMSYDGIALREMVNRFPEVAITASDYVQNNLAFFRDTFGIETLHIDAENALDSTDARFDAITCFFQAHFTPRFDELLRSARKLMKPDGVLFIATVRPSVVKRAYDRVRGSLRKLRGKPVNIYEGNAFYRIGPFADRTAAAIDRAAVGLELVDAGTGPRNLRGYQVQYRAYRKR